MEETFEQKNDRNRRVQRRYESSERCAMPAADFIERRRLRDWRDPQAALLDAIGEMHARGAIFTRAHIKELSGELIVEGWREWPDDQGDLPV